MITYELAKRLKDAGFPQHPFSAFCPCGAKTMNDPHHPTTDELIEALGEDFSYLARVVDNREDINSRKLLQWNAHGDDPENVRKVITLSGSTPREALANLYLATRGAE